ncbi:heterokaryon incompatibility protein-domain-containing protein [Nemania sp. FL0031]|nr:heterokaryon incompatibility protein-domain-containing protein [Nemania sp. FL0031]
MGRTRFLNPDLPLPSNSQGHPETTALHSEFCNGCSRTIYGTRYKCDDCLNYDYCSICVLTAALTHPGHAFITIQTPLPEPAVDMVPLFATIDDRDLALIQNDDFTSPEAVIAARDSAHHDGSTSGINIVWMPESTPRFVKDDGSVVQSVAGRGIINIHSHPPKLIIKGTDSPVELDSTKIPSHDVEVYISSKMSSDEIGRRLLEAASRLPTHGRYVQAYEPLEPTTRDIRLVKLWPDEGNASIRCETIHTWLDEELSYEALSYTWGYPHSLGLIDMNGRPFPIRGNLEDALRSIRLRDKPRTLWIDALCIDQINTDERNFQVGRMRDIYKGASRVIVFLDLEADNSGMAMDLITGDLEAGSDEAEVPQAFQADWNSYEEDEESRGGVVEASSDEATPDSRTSDKEADPTGGRRPVHVEVNDDGSLPPNCQFAKEDEAETPREFYYYSDDEENKPERHSSYDSKSMRQRAWVALDKLVRRPWWNRVWVLQEVVVSEADPILICGNRQIFWKEFHNFLLTHHSVSQVGFATEKLSIQQRVAISARYRSQHFFGIRKHHCKIKSISSLLLSTMTLDATDARDKVFALVGLAPEADRRVLAPDYFKSLTKVYTETTKHIVNSTRRLDILSFNTSSEISNEPLPSWVSDWRLGASRPAPLYGEGLYHASGRFPACICPSSISPPNNLSHLVLGGILIDEVNVVSDIIDPEEPGLDMISAWRHIIRKLESLLLMNICHQKSQLPFIPRSLEEQVAWRRIFALDPDPRNSDQLWRTLVTNRTLTNETPAPAAFAEMFELLFYQSADTPSRRIFDEGMRSRLGFNFPRLQTPQPSRIPRNFRLELPYIERLALYAGPLVAAMARSVSRVLFTTNAGRMGVASVGVRPHDKVVILMGGDMPCILRDREASDRLQFVG